MIHDDMPAKQIRKRRAEVALEAIADEICDEEGLVAWYKIALPFLRAHREHLPDDPEIHRMVDCWDAVNEVMLDEPWDGEVTGN